MTSQSPGTGEDPEVLDLVVQIANLPFDEEAPDDPKPGTPGKSNLRVTLAAASEMRFDIRNDRGMDYNKLIHDICKVAPAMMEYDCALMEYYDDAGRTPLPRTARHLIASFVDAYHAQIHNIQLVLPGFDRLRDIQERRPHG